MSRPRIVIATRNPGKLREIQEVLAGLEAELVSLAQLDPAGRIAEPEETGQTFADNARAKAEYYARATGLWALADDSGLQVDALGGAPGVQSARFAGVPKPGATRQQIDQANNARLLEELAGVPERRRAARFRCHLALHDGRRVRLEADGVIEGRIISDPRGANGFGYDPLFYVDELGCTTAELPSERKNQVSHRGQALRQFASRLKELLTAEPAETAETERTGIE